MPEFYMSKPPSFSRVQLRRAYAAQRQKALQAGMHGADFDLLANAHVSMADILNNFNRETVLFAPTRAAMQLQPTPIDKQIGTTIELEFVEHKVATITYRLTWAGSGEKARELRDSVEALHGPSLPYWGDEPYSVFEAVFKAIADEFELGQIVITDATIIFERIKHVLSDRKYHLYHDTQHRQFQINYARGQYFVTWIYTYSPLIRLNRDVRNLGAEE